MNVLLVWSWIFPVVVGLTIVLNRWTKWPHSWGIGALAQAGQIVMAFLYKEQVFGLWLSFIPMVLFVLAWVTAVVNKRVARGESVKTLFLMYGWWLRVKASLREHYTFYFKTEDYFWREVEGNRELRRKIQEGDWVALRRRQ